VVADLALKYRLPTMTDFRELPENGGFMSFGPDLVDSYRRAATHVDKILKGANPADLPMRMPPKSDIKSKRCVRGLTAPCYTLSMAKKITLGQKIDALTSIVEKMHACMEKGFAAVAEDIGDIKRSMPTKDQLSALQTQVNSIEHQLRETKIEVRLGDLEEKVFGAPRR
jgi:hypothetical protein